MRKKWPTKLAAVLAVSLLAAGCGANPAPQKEAEMSAAESVQQTEAGAQSQENADSQAPGLKDDFYASVNYDLLDQWEIPAHLTSISWLQLLDEENYQRIDGEIKAAAENQDLTAGSDAWNIAALYLTGLDKEARDNGGFGQIAGGYLEEIDKAETVAQLLEASLRFHRNYGMSSFCGFSYSSDYEDSTKKVLYASSPDTGLEKEIWFSDDEENKKQAEAYVEYLKQLHVQAGASEEEAEETVNQVTDLMKSIAGESLSIEDQYDAAITYNVYPVSSLPDFLLNGLVTAQQLKDIYGTDSDEILVIEDEGAAACLSSYLTEENLPLLKEYVKTCLYSDTSSYRQLEALDIRQDYIAAINGTEKLDFERCVSESVQNALSFQCGKLFCDKYFSEEAKEDVTEMVEEVIQVYDQRISDLDWMTDSTKEEARKKLAAISSAVGYPDVWPQDRYELSLSSPEDGGLYMDNYLSIAKAVLDYSYATKDEPVDKTEWLMAPQVINAYYNPSSNSITLLAGILQEPVYSPEASKEENLGAIGAVIGHEITHAFDTSGSQYDEVGNLRDWWTEEDLKNFQELAEKTEKYYSSMEIDGKPINGSLTVTENIADLGAIACVTQIAVEKGYDLEAVYRSYANLWAEKTRPEALSMQLSTDVHSPGKIRVNAVLSAIDEFYQVFDVQEGDGMYQKPEERPAIW